MGQDWIALIKEVEPVFLVNPVNLVPKVRCFQARVRDLRLLDPCNSLCRTVSSRLAVRNVSMTPGEKLPLTLALLDFTIGN